MLVKWGSIIVKGSGKLGGHVFSGGPSGASVHTLAKARNPQTKYQMGIRSRFTQLTQGWRNLTETQRESWYDAVSSFSRVNRFGDVVTLSGKNLYESLNNNLLGIGASIQETAPMPGELNVNRVDRVVIDTVNETITITGTFRQFFGYQVVATEGLSQGVKSGQSKERFIIARGALGGGGGISAPNLVYQNYVRRFAEPRIGEKIFVGTYTVNTSGQKSTNSIVQAELV